jgi:inward rectifier potassium channel
MSSSKPRILRPDGSVDIDHIGRPRRRGAWATDLGHMLLTTTWPRFFLVVVVTYLAINLVFAGLFASCGDCISNARPQSFIDRFFFSVQTLATIGYGQMTPQGVFANILVAVEALVGMLFLALMAGLFYARFTRPTAGVLFSRRAVIGRFEGKPALMLRISNARGDEIIEASASLTMARDEPAHEAGVFRRLYDLTLVRSATPTFSLSWTMIHVIDPSSPLFGATPETLAESRTEFLVLFTGHHQGFGQRVHVRRAYAAEDLVWNARFGDMISDMPNGKRVIDLSRFDQIESSDSDYAGLT